MNADATAVGATPNKSGWASPERRRITDDGAGHDAAARPSANAAASTHNVIFVRLRDTLPHSPPGKSTRCRRSSKDMTVAEAADALGVSTQTIYNYIHAGAIVPFGSTIVGEVSVVVAQPGRSSRRTNWQNCSSHCC
jgi:hypothetical protein